MFSHSPCRQMLGLRSHSFTSAGQKHPWDTPRTPPVWLWGQEAELGHRQGTARASPMQVFMSRDAMKPSKHRQRYSPGMLVHCPPSQISGLSSHSSISAERRPCQGEHRESWSTRGKEEIPNCEQLDVAVQSKVIHLWKGLENETPSSWSQLWGTQRFLGQHLQEPRWALTCTGPLVWHQGIAFTAAALVAALGVGAVGVTAPVGDGALVDVWGQPQHPELAGTHRDPALHRRGPRQQFG